MNIKSISIAGMLLFAAALAAAQRTASTREASQEYALKGAFLLRIADFVDTPRAADGPVVLTILGDDPFGESLDAAARGKTIDGAPMQVRRASCVDEVVPRGIVFISRSESPRLATILSALRDKNSLTVGDVDGFAAAGGMIGFVVEGNRIRFDMNPRAARRAGVQISARLLNLARIIHDGSAQ